MATCTTTTANRPLSKTRIRQKQTAAALSLGLAPTFDVSTANRSAPSGIHRSRAQCHAF